MRKISNETTSGSIANKLTLNSTHANLHPLFSAFWISVAYCLRILSEGLEEGVSDFAGDDVGRFRPSTCGSDFYGKPM